MNLRAVKGMNDILPEEIGRWHQVEAAYRRTLERCGFREVRTPVVEATPLFVRSLGEGTDVVDKEMYTFQRHHDDLTLRPEGTAGAARAYLEHGVQNREPVTRWYYVGPMFRGERPARGRYRQFYQAGAEVYGDPGPVSDADMIDMLVGWLGELGIGGLEVVVNSLGSAETRTRYREALVTYLTPHRAELSEDSQQRFERNPLRILDSKNARDQALCADAPSLLDCLDPEDRAHFDGVLQALDALGTRYRIEPRLVRGLDYYTRTLFEIRTTSGELGAQSALCGGGRYDGLCRSLGSSHDVPCIGFAAGLERILLAMTAPPTPPNPFVMVAPIGEEAAAAALVLARDLRRAGVEAHLESKGQRLKAILRRADSSGATLCLLLGEEELANQRVRVKQLAQRTEEDVPRANAVTHVVAQLAAIARGASVP